MSDLNDPSPHHPHQQRAAGGMNRREFLRITTVAGTGVALTGLAAKRLRAQTTPTGPGAIRFAVIGDFGETAADQTFPVDRVGAMVRSWNPDFLVTTGDNNYVFGEAATIDVNVGKNFTGYIFPKTTDIPVQYPYPPGAPPFNRCFPCLGNHDYADIQDDELPSLANVAFSTPYLQYFRNALRTGTPPNTIVTFADNAVGQTWTRATISGDVEDYAAFSETENLRFYDVRLGTAAGPSSVHLFFFDSNSGTPYGRYFANRLIPNRDGTNSTFTEIATQGQWLQQRLAASTAQWKIVILHHPPYNSAPGAENSQYTFARWPFQAWGATAVIAGHVHNYERLEMPDADANGDPIPGNPTIPYLVNGAGGFIPEQGFDPGFVVPGSKVRVAEYGAQLVTADENSLNLLYYDIDGVLRDVRTIYANDAAGPPQVEFAGREFPVTASAGTVAVTVERLGNTGAALTVAFATMDGTAVAGVNYAATSGSQVFAPGERTKTIPVTIFVPPEFPDDVVPWESLIFSVGLSQPSAGSLGFFSVAAVIMVNTVDTPITNQTLFVVQCYRDIFQTTPTNSEIQTARAAIGTFDSWIFRARWLYNLMVAEYGSEPVFPAAQVYASLNLSSAVVLANQAAPPSFPDLQTGVSLWRSATSTDNALVALSQAFNQNIIAILENAIPGLATDNGLFITTVYTTLILPVGNSPTAADTAYWQARLSNSSASARLRSRNLMLGRVATESFSPPPVAGMTAFDLTQPSENGNEVLLGIIVAGLLRIQLTYQEFLTGYLLPARVGGGIAITDSIYNAIQSATYAARFRVTSFEGYIDSVKSGRPLAERAPGVDPENDGRTNLDEYSFALILGGANAEVVTELEVEDDAGQRFAILSYRQAANVRRVEFLVQTSTDLATWTGAVNPVMTGGEDRGTHIKRRIRFAIPSSDQRVFYRVQVRPTN